MSQPTRSVFRDTLITLCVSGAVAVGVLLCWATWDAWSSGKFTDASFWQGIATVFAATRSGVVAILLCCAIAALGVTGTLRRFQNSIADYQGALARIPNASPTAKSGEDSIRNKNIEYSEATALARAVDDVHRAFSDRESRFERSKLRLRDQLNQRTQEAEEAGARAHHLAMIDPLTKLPNRMMLNEALDKALEDALAQRAIACALFIDIDHFKRLNDSLGHELGDRVLMQVALTLRQSLRDVDIAARLGGDEFVVVLRNLPPDSAKAIVERYLGSVYTALRNPIDLGGRTTLITLSIGAALYPSDAGDAAALLRAADSAMYAAKQKGRNRADWFRKEILNDASTASQREQSLREAIANKQLTMVFQPQVRTDDGTPVGVEALVRWKHPKKGMIAPAQFIPLAEQSGLIVPLGQRVLDLTLSQAKRWEARELNMRISVNLSVKQLEQQGWVESLQGLIESYGLPASIIDLEITESAIADDPIAMEKTLRNLAARGFTLSLDDFGTGFSSLNYLARFPFHHVKIDQQFIHDIDSPASRNVVQSIIALGHTLQMRTIAEGVETPQQFRILRDLGCDEVQGFFVAEPMAPELVLTWWQERLEATQFLSEQEWKLAATNVHTISPGRSTSAAQPPSSLSSQ